jgi:TRAP-type mannitol/chloroaromatic compound transport system substrate-binding protein
MLLTPGDYMIWYWQAGGLELTQKLYADYNIVWYPHSVTSPESGQRTNVAIKELTDYSGLKLRQCGRTQALILERLGASAVFLPGADIYLSVDRGVVDGAEFGVPETDWSMAFQEISKYHIGPGWHQPGPVSGVMINKDSYDKLPDHVKYVFKEAAMASMMWAWTYFEYTSGIYQNKFSDAGVTISKLSDDAIEQIQQTSWDVLLEDATANPNHARIAFSQLHFLMTYAEWREFQSPLTHGRNPSGLEETYTKLEKIVKDFGVYDEVIAAADESLIRAQAQEHWAPGTPYVQNPIAP